MAYWQVQAGRHRNTRNPEHGNTEAQEQTEAHGNTDKLAKNKGKGTDIYGEWLMREWKAGEQTGWGDELILGRCVGRAEQGTRGMRKGGPCPQTHIWTETDTDWGALGTQGNTGGNHWGKAMAVTYFLLQSLSFSLTDYSGPVHDHPSLHTSNLLQVPVSVCAETDRHQPHYYR